MKIRKWLKAHKEKTLNKKRVLTNRSIDLKTIDLQTINNNYKIWSLEEE